MTKNISSKNMSKKNFKNRSKELKGGSGQGNQGHDVSMPIQYYGKELNRYFPTDSKELIAPNSAYGSTIATSHGVSIPGNDKFVGPDLAPFNKSIGISGIQTGGIKSSKNLKKKQVSKSKKQKGSGKLNLRCMNMDCGPPFHPMWTSPNQQGGKKMKRQSKFSQLGGDGQGNQGHDVSMPIQYYGKELNRYFPTGSPELITPNSAYGPTIATNMGVSIPGNNKFVGPDLGAFNKSIGNSGIQTGGGLSKKNKNQKGSGKLNLRCMNMDCGPAFHPMWKSLNQQGGKNKKRNKFSQNGGDGQGNQGHDVSMPIQYFGKELNRYFPTGSPELIAPNSAYGPTIATNMGVSIPGNNKFVGPDLGAFNKSIGISGIQTGGGSSKKKGGG